MKDLDFDKIERDELTGEVIIYRKNRNTGAYEKEYLSEKRFREKIIESLSLD